MNHDVFLANKGIPTEDRGPKINYLCVNVNDHKVNTSKRDNKCDTRVGDLWSDGHWKAMAVASGPGITINGRSSRRHG